MESPMTIGSIIRTFSLSFKAGGAVETAAAQALQACAANNIEPNINLLATILSAISSDQKSPPEAVLSWFAKMRAMQAPGLDSISCNLVLRAHVNRNDVANAVVMLTQMMREESQRDGLPRPDAISFNTVIAGLAKAEQPVKAESLLTAMIDFALVAPTSATYASVVNAFARAKDPVSAEKWLKRMLTAKSSGDTQSEIVCFNSTLLAYANVADADGALRVLNVFQKRARDECPNASPDVISYNTAILACARAKKLNQAEATFRQMEAHHVAPNAISYSTVIHAFSNAGQADKAQAWLEKMLKIGLVADAVPYNSVCVAHARRGDVSAALATFQLMVSAGVTASAQTHSAMIHAFVQAGDAPQALTSLQALMAAGEPLDASPFNSLITLYAKQCRPDQAEAVLILMGQHTPRIRPSLITFNALAVAHAATGDVDAAELVLMRATGPPFYYRLDRYSFGALLQACCNERHGRQTPGAPPSKQTPRERQRRASREQFDVKKTERAKRIVLAMWEAGIELNSYLRSRTATALGTARAADELRLQFEAGEISSTDIGQTHPVPPVSAAHNPSTSHTPSSSSLDTIVSESTPTGDAPAHAPPHETDEEMGEEDQEGEEDDGWTKVAAPRRQRSTGNQTKGGGLRSASKTIAKNSKTSRLPRNASNGALADMGSGEGADSRTSASVGMRAVGGTLTRSRSERARLMALAGTALDDPEREPTSPPRSENGQGTEETTNKAGGAGGVAGASPSLRRSMASQLALDLMGVGLNQL